jgi:hypothetical protein
VPRAGASPRRSPARCRSFAKVVVLASSTHLLRCIEMVSMAGGWSGTGSLGASAGEAALPLIVFRSQLPRPTGFPSKSRSGFDPPRA